MYFVKQQDHVRGEDTDSGVKETYIQVLALPFSAHVTLGTLLNLFEFLLYLCLNTNNAMYF